MAFKHGTPNSIVTDGLVFCVDPANISSWTGPNSSNVNDLVGTSTNTISNDPSGSYGINKSFIFDGVDDKIATTFNPSTSIGDNNSWTINCWVYNQDVTAGSGGKQRILGSINLGGTVKRFWLGARGGRVRVGYGNSNWALSNNLGTYVNTIWPIIPYILRSLSVSSIGSPTVSGSPCTTKFFNRCILSFNLNHKPVSASLMSASVSKLVPTLIFDGP